jgi:hypothetical protein
MNCEEDPKSKLRVRSSDPRRLVVGNIHVLFNPKRGDIKLGQVCLARSLQNSDKNWLIHKIGRAFLSLHILSLEMSIF